MNPFPGPRPYRSDDRHRFFGREELARRVTSAILVHRCVVLSGPSGAGKSSLMQAAVLPRLEEAHDFRAVRVDGWPAGRPALEWLADAMFEALKLGAPPPSTPPAEAIAGAIERASRRSDRPIVIYLDQLEQLLLPGRSAHIDAVVACADDLAERPLRGLGLVLSLREDYLGRLRDRARGRWRLLDHGLRVGQLTVGELTEAVCRAARSGDPPRAWSPESTRALMLQVRAPGQEATDEAEAQSAYAQIVCRALWADEEHGAACGPDGAEAEPILERYLDSTLEGLGALQDDARRLLEDHLISADGSRTLRTEKELVETLPMAALGSVLAALEGAAVLRAEEHQGSRYFELGHDWLARRVYEQKQQRERDEAHRLREEALERELARQREHEENLRRVAGFAAAGRTRLNDVIGYCELLIDESEETGRPDLVSDLLKIKGAGHDLLALVDAILSASGVRQGAGS
jgi:hypothetical protein